MATFIGSRRTDIYNGTDGNDIIDGGGGADTLRGGAGDDVIVYQNDANRGNVIEGGSGIDTLLVRQAARIDLGAANQDAGGRSNAIKEFENVDGRQATDAVWLAGSDGANHLRGGAQDDTLKGRKGADLLEGGAGRDLFVYDAAADSDASAWDTIVDFQPGQDKIDLSALGSNLRWSADMPLAHGVWQQQSGTTLFIHADTNGDGIGDFRIELRDTAALARSDFLGVSDYTNTPPVANPDTRSIAEDAASAAVSGNLLQNDTDPDASAPLAVRDPGTYRGLYGTLVVKANGDYTYTLDNASAAVQQLRDGDSREDSFTYAASDGIAAATSTLRIIVTGSNDAPVVSGIVQAAVNEDGASVSLDALAHASDVDDAVLSVVSLPSPLPQGVSYDANSARFTLDPSHAAFQHLAAGQTTTVSVHYGVSDGKATSAATATWTLTGANDAPVVSGAVTGNAIEDGAPVTLSALARASDIDGNTLSVTDLPASLPAGVTYDALTRSFTLDPSHAAFQALDNGRETTVTVNYKVFDGHESTPASVSWTVAGRTDTPDNQAPVVTGPVNGNASEDGAAVTLDALANASDPDSSVPLNVILRGALPDGVSYAPLTKSFTLDPAHARFQSLAHGQTLVVTVDYDVSDGSASTPARATWTITGANDHPVVSATVTTGASEDGAAVSLDALAHASDVDDAVLSVVSLPSPLPQGVSYDAASARFTLDPSHASFQYLAAGQTTTVSVHYGISDGKATTAAIATWTLTGANDAPVVSGAVTGNAIEDGAPVTLSALARASDIDGNTLSVTELPASLPAGVTYDAVTRSFTLDPSHAAFQALDNGRETTVTVNYKVFDGHASTPASVSWTVAGRTDTPDNRAPVVTGPVNANANEDGAVVTLDALANASDPDSSLPLSVILHTGLPAGVTYDATSRQFTLDPAHQVFQSLGQGQSVVVAVDYQVSDGTASTPARAAWTVTGTNDLPRVAAPVPDQLVERGSPFSFVLPPTYASDIDTGAVLGYRATLASGGALPSWLSFDPSTRTLSGTAPVGEGVESLDLVIEVRDETGATVQDAFVLSLVGAIRGTPGPDYNLTGFETNDLIYGLESDDYLYGRGGNDQLDGGTGNDHLYGEAGDDVLIGGDGDDVMQDTNGANSFYGGAGNDTIYLNASQTQLVIDGGEGDDRFYIDTRTSAQTVTTGSGADTIELRAPATSGGEAVTITDFTTGADGDKINLSAGLLPYSSGYAHASDPFATGYLRLVQVGANAELQWDSDGGASSASWSTVLVFSGRQAADFTLDNFIPMFNPHGTGVGKTITGTDNSESLTGTQANDTIHGLGGSDYLYGDFGNDSLHGGADSDHLSGGYGDDTLEGGDGADNLYGESGNDILRGGAGNDTLQDSTGVNSLYGGDGNDTIYVDANDTQLVIDGGAGDDGFYITNRSAAQTVTTGSGSDTIQFYYPSVSGHAVTITDFSTGAGGDKIDIGAAGASILQYSNGYQYGADPFATGYLRMVQNGANAELHWRKDGPAGGDAWSTLLVFSNVQAGSFTLDNFTPGFNPNGTGAGKTITGTDNSESLTGTQANDTIHGLGGSDSLFGDFGNDSLHGGAGSDYLSGGYGDDTLEGGDDNDNLYGESGNDILRGGAGNDTLQDGSGANSLYGGDGNDTIYVDANDTQLVIDGGAGDDLFYVTSRTAAQTVTTGSGSDTIQFYYPAATGQAITITDFSTGAGGDKIDIGLSGVSILQYSNGYQYGSDPFITGYLRMVQNGANAELQWRKDGPAGGDAWSTVLVFSNVQAGSFTLDNFAPGFNPNGTGAGKTVTGTGDAESLTGTPSNDTLHGLGGGDYLYGDFGNDSLHGGAGSDYLSGGYGDDTLEGGDDNDNLYGESGNDILRGGAGNDTLQDNAGVNSLYGGDGNDTIYVDANDTQLVIDGGAGDDLFYVTNRNAVQTITTGSGSDTFQFYYPAATGQAITITDFSTGAGGDKIDIGSASVSILQYSNGYQYGTDPFATGYLRMVQNGANAELHWRKDGPAGGDAWSTLLVFSNVQAGSFTVDNFTPGFNPNGTGAGRTVTGTGDAETLNGTQANDTLHGLGGDDHLFGDFGNDSLHGGAGSDYLSGGYGDDTLEGGDDNDNLYGESGNDILRGGAGNDTLQDSTGVNSLYGGDGNDTIYIDAGATQLVIDGGAGEDLFFVSNRTAAQTVTTGDGSDTIQYYFPSATGQAITITDFSTGVGGDKINLNAGYSILQFSNGYVSGADPFATGYLRMVQNGADAELHWRSNGPADGNTWSTLIVFKGVQAADFRTSNFVPAYSPNGADPSGSIGGTEGNDTLTGTAGDDLINGLGGDDRIDGMGGNDTLDGGDGNDILEGNPGNDILIGGAGNDRLSVGAASGTDSLYGGDGNDELEIHSDLTQLVIDGGAGDDLIRFGSRGAVQTVTTGSGSDTLGFYLPSASGQAIRVTDFTPGNGGDQVHLDPAPWSLMGNSTGYTAGANPFASEHLRLVQVGADTQLQWDQDGSSNGGSWSTLFIFQNVSASALTADNFGGHAPMTTILGTPGWDTLTGSIHADFIYGFDGNDRISGDRGNDVIYGGDGDDTLDGQQNHDVLIGGDGNDRLTDYDGYSVMDGGAGNDILEASGDTAILHGGDGNDQFYLGSLRDEARITTGAGIDSISLSPYMGAIPLIMDFTTGPGGDVIDLGNEYMWGLLYMSEGWKPGLDPFAAGFLRLEGDESGTTLYWDTDGVNSDWPEQAVARFNGADIASFTAENFSIGFTPLSSRGATLQGTSADDALEGSNTADIILGLDGNDSIVGQGGDDWVDGGAGDDLLTGAFGNDAVHGGDGNDTLYGGEGDDVLFGGDGDDTFIDSEGSNAIYGGFGNDIIWLYDTEQRVIHGGYGNDEFMVQYVATQQLIVTGGDSDRIFVTDPRQTGWSGYGDVTVADFSAGQFGDTIDLGDGGMGGILAALEGWDTSTNPFETGFLRLIWDGSDTRLQWDANGAALDESWTTLLVLKGVYAGDLTKDNFATGWTWWEQVTPIFDGQLTPLVGSAPPLPAPLA